MSLQCRVCLFKVDIESSTDLFSETSTGELISEVLTSLAPVYIFQGDGFPDRICLNCEKKLIDVLDFRSLLISSNSELQKLAVTTSCNESFTKQNVSQNIELMEDCIKVEPETIQEDSCASLPNFICDTCGKAISNQSFPEPTHDPDKPLICYDCDKAFRCNSSFQQHKQLIHNEAGYRCHKCGTLIQTHESFKNDLEQNSSPHEIEQTDQNTVPNLLPDKSHLAYEKQYQKFEEWREANNIEIISENVLLEYFDLQRSKYKPSTLWTTFSMLRSCLNIYKNVDISKYNKLLAFLKRSSEGYLPTKSKILGEEDINKFIQEADDKIYLAFKIILIMGYSGSCRLEELTNMCIDDLQFKSNSITVNVPRRKNNVRSTFAITNEKCNQLIKKYISLRPKTVTHKRLFLTYRNGYCVNSPIGKNTIGKVPRNIAVYLKLPNPELYAYSFRRSNKLRKLFF